jgi:hypothetical protein
MKDRFWRKAAIPNIGCVGVGVLRVRNDLSLLTGCADFIPTALPIRSLASGDTKEIEPALGSASSSPTIRYFCTRPSSRLKVTVLPKATVSVDEALVMT